MKSVLITGGSGSFGKAFVSRLLDLPNGPERICVYSRGEHAQQAMEDSLRGHPRFDRLRFFIGDVRDFDRLRRAMKGCETVVHAAALKIVPAMEYNPDEAVKTNILGTMNVINAAADVNAKRVVALSSDKAAAAFNLYGSTKYVLERLMVAANAWAPHVKFACVRYGNVTGSNGSVVPRWRKAAAEGRLIQVTDPRCTRFWMTLAEATQLVLDVLGGMTGGEIVIPKIPAYSVLDLAAAVGQGARVEYVGLRPGEKLHESLVVDDEAPETWELDNAYVILPPGRALENGKRVVEGFRFRSDEASMRLGVEDLTTRLEALGI